MKLVGLVSPRKTPLPSTEMGCTLPCTMSLAPTMFAPNAYPMAWWPRHTPRIGTSPANARITSIMHPASSGRPGPGDKMMALGASARMPATSMASLRMTCTSSEVSSHKYW